MTAAAINTQTDTLVDGLVQAIGPERVMTTKDDRRFYSQDVYRSGVPPLAVVRPGSVEEVQRCVALCAASGAAIVPRGGGMSYTDGYLSARAHAVAFDLQALDRIVSLDVEDRVVTVEAGCTWRTLEAALAPHGLRTPYWGPFSGRNATIGGAMSQNSAFWGAVQAGSAAQNVLGLEVVLADASLLGVGALGGRAQAPVFWRDHGPDLTGLFTGDCGALGLKVRVTLPLERRPASRGVVAFSFADPHAVLRALSAMAREQLISEACFFDKGQQDARVTDARVPLRQMIATAGAVAKEAGIGAAVGMALAGQRYLAEVPCSLNLIVEGSCAADLKRRLVAIRAIAKVERARPLNAMIARVLTADHFPTAETTLADHRFLPVHAIVPHSRAAAVYRGVTELFAAHADDCRRLAVTTGVFSIAVGAGAILIEPTWHWTGAFLESHPRLFAVPSQRLGHHAPNHDAEAFVGQMRERMLALFLEAGAAHFQLGKVYPFRRSRGTANIALLDDLKRRLDPEGLMNPGALGWE